MGGVGFETLSFGDAADLYAVPFSLPSADGESGLLSRPGRSGPPPHAGPGLQDFRPRRRIGVNELFSSSQVNGVSNGGAGPQVTPRKRKEFSLGGGESGSPRQSGLLVISKVCLSRR